MRIELNPAGLAGLMAESERQTRERAKRAVSEIARDAKALAPVDTGRLRASIDADHEGLKVTVDAPYWAPVEYGHRVVAWGHETGKYEPPQPFMRPAAYRQAGGA